MRFLVVVLVIAGCGGPSSGTNDRMDGNTIDDGAVPVSTVGDAAVAPSDFAVADLAEAENDLAHDSHADLAMPKQGDAPAIVQYAVHQSPSAPAPYTATAPFENNSTVTFDKATKSGNIIWVVATVSDYGGVHTVSVTDTQNNKYTQLDQENDGQPGSQTVVHFWAKSIAGDKSSPDVVTVAWGSDNYKGVLAVEISGATTLLDYNGVIQDNLAKGTANVLSKSYSVSEVPALLVALSMSTDGGGSDTGGNGCAGASASSGFTSVDTMWDWSTVTLGTLESRAIDSASSVKATYDAPCAGPYVTVSAVFK